MRMIGQDVIMETENLFFCDNRIWFTEFRSGDFYFYDLVTKETTLFCKNPAEHSQSRAYGSIVKEKEYFYLIPFYADKMYKIGRLDQSVEAVDLNCMEDTPSFQEGYLSSSLSAHVYNGKIYVISALVSCVIEYDCSSGQVSYYGNWEEKGFAKYQDEIVCCKSLLFENKIYIPYCKGNLVAVFDLKTKDFKIYTVGSGECRYSAIGMSGDDFLLMPRRNDRYVCWNDRTGCVRELDDSEKSDLKNSIFEDMDFSGINGCRQEEMIYLFSMQTGKLYLYDTLYKEIEERYISAPSGEADEFRKVNSAVYKAFHEGSDIHMSVLREDYNDAVHDLIGYIEEENKSDTVVGAERMIGSRVWQKAAGK